MRKQIFSIIAAASVGLMATTASAEEKNGLLVWLDMLNEWPLDEQEFQAQNHLMTVSAATSAYFSGKGQGLIGVHPACTQQLQTWSNDLKLLTAELRIFAAALPAEWSHILSIAAFAVLKCEQAMTKFDENGNTD